MTLHIENRGTLLTTLSFTRDCIKQQDNADGTHVRSWGESNPASLAAKQEESYLRQLRGVCNPGLTGALELGGFLLLAFAALAA